MSDDRYARLYRRIETALKEKSKRTALYTAMKRGRDSRQAALEALTGGEAFRQEVRAVKLRCLEKQDELIDRFAARARERGTNVFLAKDGAAAIAYILKLAAHRRAKTVAKSKSLTSEEIEVNQPLEAAGMDVIETDLGELIIQKVDEKPFHLVFPAVHKTAGEVAEIFAKVTGENVPNDIDAIMKVVRKYLRPIFLNADIGMTGANIGIAETGTIAIETNEGNGRLVSSIPDVHICIMGQEKIVETVEDAFQMILAHPISAVGQHLTTYVTMMGGRSPLGTGDGLKARESHIIILDNGRSKMKVSPLFSDALNCIRCGACMNICPTYGVVGGHTFGHIYPGPIGIPWTSEIHGLGKAGDFAPLCISCGLCMEICPAQIDMPMMIAGVRDRVSKDHPHPLVNRVLMEAELIARLGSATAPIANWFMRNAPFRRGMEKSIGIDRRRQLPAFSRKTLVMRFRRRGSRKVANPVRRVAFFMDLYANYNAPELGMAAIELLEALGCEVVIPPQRGCGYPYIGYGDLKKARQVAVENVGHLAPYVERGYEIVSTEPTATYCLKVSYPKLMDNHPEAVAVAEHSHEFFKLVELLENEIRAGEQISLKGRSYGFHISCHQRSLGAGSHAIDFLKRRGAEIEVIETGTCCGMAGTFGLKKGFLGYALSQAVGEPLFEEFKNAGVEAIVTESSVCRIHLREGTGMRVWHPLELLRTDIPRQ
jgi:iron-sulfur cluster protein